MQEPLTVVIFGVTGDLYQNKLASALFNLFSLSLLPAHFGIVGFARRAFTHSEFQTFTKEAILNKNKEGDPKKLEEFLSHLKYTQGDLENPEDFIKLGKNLSAYDQKKGICTDKLFYLATPPTLYATIFKNISFAGLTIPCSSEVEDRVKAWTRVLVEKPFGKNISDAENLDLLLGELFHESQIFRIDHYLAKEALQNILTFRFVNGSLEPFWNNQHIKKVRIIFHEENVVGQRGAFYDGLGALRDVGQNHMLQILALVAMENPGTLSGSAVHSARASVLEKISLRKNSSIVRGQYQGYLEEPGVNPDSKIETFFRLELLVDNERWRGVPFEFEGGKGLNEALVQVEVDFKDSRPSEKFSISAHKSVPYDAHEKVLYDAITGDQTIFTTTKEIMAQWRLITETIEAWQSLPLVTYPKGATGEEIQLKLK